MLKKYVTRACVHMYVQEHTFLVVLYAHSLRIQEVGAGGSRVQGQSLLPQ